MLDFLKTSVHDKKSFCKLSRNSWLRITQMDRTSRLQVCHLLRCICTSTRLIALRISDWHIAGSRAQKIFPRLSLVCSEGPPTSWRQDGAKRKGTEEALLISCKLIEPPHQLRSKYYELLRIKSANQHESRRTSSYAHCARNQANYALQHRKCLNIRKNH